MLIIFYILIALIDISVFSVLILLKKIAKMYFKSLL